MGTTKGLHICQAPLCNGSMYQSGWCAMHYRDHEPTPVTCGHDQAFITCGCCGRQVCADCYGEWNVLACHECRERARATP